MATNQTQRYGLHLWEPGDDFLREEFNENFAVLDAIPEAVTGSYTGDGAASQFIALGFTPKAVLVFAGHGCTADHLSTYYGGLALPGRPVAEPSIYARPVLAVEEGGFRVYYYIDGPRIFTNSPDCGHYFAALR